VVGPFELVALVADGEVEAPAAEPDGVADEVAQVCGAGTEARDVAVVVARQHMIIGAAKDETKIDSGRDHYCPDRVLTDWVKPLFHGLELTQMLRQPGDNANPYVPIIMLTGHSEKKRVTIARDAGVTEFMVKPISAKALYQRVLNIVANPRPFVKTQNYFGPDRRRNVNPIYVGPDRRKGGKADTIRQTGLLEKAKVAR